MNLGPGVLGSATLICVLGAFSSACSSDSDEGGSGKAAGTVELYPTTKVLDPETLASITTVSDDYRTITFARPTKNLLAGDVVMGGIGPKTPSGLLRRVTEVTVAGDTTTLTTERAALTDAIKKGRVTLPATTLVRATARPEPSPGTTIQSLDADALARDFTVGVQPFTVADGVTLGGSLGFGLAIELDLQIDDKAVVGRMSLAGAETATLDLNAIASNSFETSKRVAVVPFPPLVIPVVGVPIVITPQLNVDVGIKGNTGAELTWSASETAGVEVGVAVSSDDGVSPILDGSASATADPVNIAAGTSLKAYTGLSLEVSMNALIAEAMFTVGAEGYVKLDSNNGAGPSCFVASAGVDARVSANGGLIGGVTFAETEKTANVVDSPFASGECSTEPITVAGWSTVLGPSDVDRDPSVAVLPDSSVIVASNSSFLTGYLARLAPRGELLWEHKLDGTVSVADVATSGPAFWIGGGAGDGPTVMRVGSDGEPTLSKTLQVASGGPAISTQVYAPTAAGGIVVAGSALQDSGYVVWAAKLDPSGEVVWAHTYGALGEPHALTESRSGDIVLVGETNVGPSANTAVIALSADGAPKFVKTYGTGRLYGVTATETGVAAVGATATGSGAIVLDIAADGALNFGFSYEDEAGSPEFRANAVALAPGGLIVAGRRDFGDASEAWALQVMTTGDLGWSRAYGGTKQDEFFSVATTPDGGAVFAGETESFNDTTQILLVRTPPSGAIVFDSSSGASATNISGIKRPLPGDPTDLVATSAPLELTAEPLSQTDWTFEPTSATRNDLAP